MSAVTTKGPIVDPGMCRCCGFMKRCRVLNVEYTHMGKKEVYADMIMDCFGLLLSNMDGSERDRLVCAPCVGRLREASAFRHQVLLCEEAFLLKIQRDGDEACAIKTEVKTEDTMMEDDGCGVDAPDYYDHVDDDVETEDQTSQDALKDPITKETSTEPPEEISVKKKSIKKRSSAKKAVTPAQRQKIKKELVTRMEKLNSMLKQKLNEPDTIAPITAKTRKAELLKQKANQKMSQERMLHHNTVTIVENSYVCPFKTRISNYYCYYCKDIFTDCNELRIHTLKHDPQYFEDHMEAKKITRIDITQIDCRLCNEKISSLEEFKKHLSTVHKKIIYPADTNEFLTFKLSMENLNCLECGCSFPFIDKLIEHMTDHFGKYVCDMCGACFIEESTLCQHIRGHKKVDTNFPCEICGKNFKSNYSRQLHTATVHEKRPVVHCYKCEASFLSYAQRNRHLINVHGDKRKFACQSCDKVFDVRKTMVEHTRKYHLQVCRHQCDVCDQRFYAPSQLKEHKVTHTGERNYTCDYCDKSYPRRQSLQDHIRSHTNDRRYKCNVCNSTFTQSGSLKSHMKTHEGFEMGEGFPS